MRVEFDYGRLSKGNLGGGGGHREQTKVFYIFTIVVVK